MKPSELDPEVWRRLDALLDAALDLSPDERRAFVARECRDDDELRAEMEALLRAHETSEGLLEAPASSLGAAILAERGLREQGRVGPFRLLREIGRGGMGVVYLAEDTRLGRQVALKALPPFLGTGAGAKERFAAEARAVSTLDHPNIATLYEIDETDEGQLYMVFALYEGETLASRIARGPLPSGDALEIALGVAGGLAAAHHAGIIHRDVKPSNILLVDDGGGVKLLDFGVAKIVGEDATGDGVRPGTVAYMSPEQASGETITESSDLWSLGVVLHEMLTGEKPFRGEHYAALVESIRRDRPPELPQGTPEALRRINGTLLQKRAESRYASASDLISDLTSVRDGGRPSFADARARRAGQRARMGRRTGIAATLGALSIVAVLAALGGLGRWPSPSVERIAVLPIPAADDGVYYADGVHDALVEQLGHFADIRVLPAPAVARYRATDLPDSLIARELAVDGLVRATLARRSGRIELAASLTAFEPLRRIWSDTLRGDESEIYQVAARMARAIATSAGVSVGDAELDRLATRLADPAATDAVMLGRYHSLRRSRADLELARRYFERAISIDPGDARAHAGLAVAYQRSATWGLAPPSEVYPESRTLAAHALTLDSLLAEAHTALAKVALEYEWDWIESARLANRALELDRGDVEAHRVLARALSLLGEEASSRRTFERAAALQSLPWELDMRRAFDHYSRREFAAATEAAGRALDFNPRVWQAHMIVCLAGAGAGASAERIRDCERAASLSEDDPIALSALGYALVEGGDSIRAGRIAAELEDRSTDRYVSASRIAIVHGALGRTDLAFDWLERAYEERDPLLLQIRNYPLFDPLRGDPRLSELFERLNLTRVESGGD